MNTPWFASSTARERWPDRVSTIAAPDRLVTDDGEGTDRDLAAELVGHPRDDARDRLVVAPPTPSRRASACARRRRPRACAVHVRVGSGVATRAIDRCRPNPRRRFRRGRTASWTRGSARRTSTPDGLITNGRRRGTRPLTFPPVQMTRPLRGQLERAVSVTSSPGFGLDPPRPGRRRSRQHLLPQRPEPLHHVVRRRDRSSRGAGGTRRRARRRLADSLVVGR